jgi:uncharacterized protein (TIGR02284 family)
MSDDRTRENTATMAESSRFPESPPEALTAKGSPATDHSVKAGGAGPEASRFFGTRAGDMAQRPEGGSDEPAWRVGRATAEADSPVAAALLGAAFGLALGYALFARMRPSRHPGRNAAAIDTLNGLIKISKDGEIGFRTAAEELKRSDLKIIFGEAANRCAESAAELQRKVRALGGEPDDSGSAIGALHRRWLDLKSAFTGKDDLAILEETERAEDAAKAAYVAALKAALPSDTRSMIDRQYQGVKQNHNRVRELRNASH